jgi:hypothetical protein
MLTRAAAAAQRQQATSMLTRSKAAAAAQAPSQKDKQLEALTAQLVADTEMLDATAILLQKAIDESQQMTAKILATGDNLTSPGQLQALHASPCCSLCTAGFYLCAQ